MRKFKTSPYGDMVDLDDPKVYNYLPQNVKDLGNLMLKEIGYALSYMDYIHPDVFDDKCDQRIRVKKLITDFWKKRKNNYENIDWYKEQIFLFQDETENMC